MREPQAKLDVAPEEQDATSEAQSTPREQPEALTIAARGCAWGLVGAATGGLFAGFGWVLKGLLYWNGEPSVVKHLSATLLLAIVGAMLGGFSGSTPGAFLGLLVNVASHALRRSRRK